MSAERNVPAARARVCLCVGVQVSTEAFVSTPSFLSAAPVFLKLCGQAADEHPPQRPETFEVNNQTKTNEQENAFALAWRFLVPSRLECLCLSHGNLTLCLFFLSPSGALQLYFSNTAVF